MSKKNRIVSKTRRGNNEGSIFQRPNGMWSGMATVGYDENGKIIRKAVYGRSRLEVAQKLTELTNRISSDNFDYISKNSFGKMMEEWLLVFKKSQVTPRTFEGNFRNFKLHIYPKIGKMKIDDVNTVVIQRLLNDMLDNNYSLASTRKVKFLINQFFEYAIQNKLTSDNPATRTKVKSNERKIYDSENKYKAISPEIRNKFIKDLDNHDFLKPLCFTMLFAGLRTGESLALRWENIDFDNKILKVECSITVIPKFDENGKVKERVTVVSDTKTACSVREVPMPDILCEALEDYKTRQYFKGKEHKIDLLAPNVLVFANNDGSVRSYSGTKKIFHRFLTKYGFDEYKIHFHGLRHTYSNMLFEANENPKVIQALLGHKSVKTTITTYNSIDKSYFKKATDLFNKEFSIKNTKQKKEANSVVEHLSESQFDKLIELLGFDNSSNKDEVEAEIRKRKKQESEM